MSQGLHKLTGAIAQRERTAWEQPCRLGDGRRVAAVIETVNGPRGICAEHIPSAEKHGYTIRREPLEGCEPRAVYYDPDRDLYIRTDTGEEDEGCRARRLTEESSPTAMWGRD